MHPPEANGPAKHLDDEENIAQEWVHRSAPLLRHNADCKDGAFLRGREGGAGSSGCRGSSSREQMNIP
jgi:hypothetical protein